MKTMMIASLFLFALTGSALAEVEYTITLSTSNPPTNVSFFAIIDISTNGQVIDDMDLALGIYGHDGKVGYIRPISSTPLEWLTDEDYTYYDNTNPAARIPTWLVGGTVDPAKDSHDNLCMISLNSGSVPGDYEFRFESIASHYGAASYASVGYPASFTVGSLPRGPNFDIEAPGEASSTLSSIRALY